MAKKLLQDENTKCNIIKNTDDGNLEISTMKSVMPKLLDMVNELIIHKKESLLKAVKILSKEDNNDAFRLIIGRDIIVKDILLPNDCIEFKITLRYTGYGSPDEDTTMDVINEVRAVIMSYGQLAVDINSITIRKSDDYKCIQLDNIVYQQIGSQSSLKAIDMKRVLRYEVNVENGSLSNYDILPDQILVQFRWP